MKVTLITGASGGIGEAITRKIAEQKNNVVLVARNEAKLQILCKELAHKYHIKANYIVADLAKDDAPKLVYDTCKKENYEVESLINNAGIGSGGEFAEIQLESELNMMQLNMNAMVSLTHQFLQDMKSRKNGTIVNVGSMISFMPIPYMALYGATKVFVRFFTQALHEECKPYNIHIMLLSPGLTETNFMQAAQLENKTGEALTAVGRTQTPEQVAEEFIAAYLKKKAAHVSGRFNRFGVKIISLIPNRTIAKQGAKSYRKRLAN